MSRAVGVTDLLSDLPALVVVAFALVTQLGDLWFVGTATVLAYLLGSRLPRLGRGLTRDRAAMLVALLAAAIAVTVSLKALFALPRPPGAGTAAYADRLPAAVRDLYASMATGDGFGFPSGHAIATTLVWGGFAWALRVGTERQRWTVAGVVVALVSLSRLVLGVHYLVDVVAGVAVAAAVLWAAVRLLGRPDRVFALVTGLGLVALLAGGVTYETAGVVGMGVGGVVASGALDPVPESTPQGAATTLALGGLFGAAGGGVVLTFGPVAPLVALLAAVGTGGLLALPLVGERVAKK
ncbi:phosphatase PAP2 family protein [Halomicroarcula sp. GCM10025324]|uniref:phosphatase PAP2 family protein n=1 Tax=Haloarcula TaxID=2237 RepID=UPI0023E78ECB|nr:phosphatase PAP2 family protein [Halomicroarcula sp. ZS-22-S1]